MKVVVVGGVAGGMSFAARARRLSEDAQIVVLEKDTYVSFANCGLPYHLADEIVDRSALLLHTPQTLAASLNLDVRTQHEVVSIRPEQRIVRVADRVNGTEYDEPYDALVLSTGATAIVPPIPGVDLPQVQVLRTVPDVDALRALVDAGARRAVVVGAGFIGLEVAEALHHRGISVAVVDLADQVMPPLDPEMARAAHEALTNAGIDVRLSTSMTEIRPSTGRPSTGRPSTGRPSTGRPSTDSPSTDSKTAGHDTAERDGSVEVELSDGSLLPADLVLLSIGVRPQTSLAAAAGLTLSPRGAVVVDEHLRTSETSIYAVGDAVQVMDAVTGQPAVVPLAGPANRQGRAAANHLFGRTGARTPVMGTAIVRVLDTVAATTGRSEKALRAAGIAHHVVHLHPSHHAGYYPGARPIHLKVMFAPDGRVLGAQATGSEGVDKRIDVIATAIRAGMDVADLADLELAYAPPFGSAKDPVNLAGFMATNVLSGDLSLWRGADLTQFAPGTQLLDVRSAAEFTAGHLPGAVNIAHTLLRARLDELAPGRPVRVYCASGFRSYLALRILRQRGWDDVASLSGGLSTLRIELPDLVLETTAVTPTLAGAR